MPRRGGAPGAAPAGLEWGQATTMPRSVVRDVVGVLVFSDSPVVPVSNAGQSGRVVCLVDALTVRVRWTHDRSVRTLPAAHVRVTGAFGGDLRPDWRVDPYRVGPGAFGG